MITDVATIHTLKWLHTQSGIPLRTIYYYIQKGEIKSYKIDGIAIIVETELPIWVKIKITNHAKQQSNALDVEADSKTSVDVDTYNILGDERFSKRRRRMPRKRYQIKNQD